MKTSLSVLVAAALIIAAMTYFRAQDAHHQRGGLALRELCVDQISWIESHANLLSDPDYANRAGDLSGFHLRKWLGEYSGHPLAPLVEDAAERMDAQDAKGAVAILTRVGNE